MAQVRRQSSNPPTAPRKIPPVPDAARFQVATPRTMRRTQSVSMNGQLPHAESPLRAIHPKQIENNLSPPPLTRLPQMPLRMSASTNGNDLKYDPLTALINNTNGTSNDNHNHNNHTIDNPYEHDEQSYIIGSSMNPSRHQERKTAPSAPPLTSGNIFPWPQDQHRKQKLHNNQTEEPTAIPSISNDDGLPVVSVDKNRLPVYARFPFDVSFLPRSMDANVEDNIHKLRLRLIDSELNYQRRSTDDYIKRTQEPFSLSSPKPNERNLRNLQLSNNAFYGQTKPSILSRQTSYSPLSIKTPVPIGGFSRLSRDRIGMENDPDSTSDIERDLEIRRIQDSLNSDRRSNQPFTISNYAYDPRIHLPQTNNIIGERQYTSSNMDDLIDSMARRHLAYRRLDVAIDRQRRGYGGGGGYTPYSEGSAIGRQQLLRNPPRDDDLYISNTGSTIYAEQDFRTHSSILNPAIRSRVDYYNRMQPDLDDLGTHDIIRQNSYAKLPPITPTADSNRFSSSRNPINSALYQARHNPQQHRSYQQNAPLSLPDNTEHLIELPSDIFLSSRTEPMGASQRHRPSHSTKPDSITKDIDFEIDQSDGESNPPIEQPQTIRREPRSEKPSAHGHHGFFTEGNPPATQQSLHSPPPPPQQHHRQQRQNNRIHRLLFQKAALGIVFINVLKHRAAKSRLNRPSLTLSATIHKIRIQEIMVALHRVYLEPDGPIYNALIQAITSPVELRDALNTSSPQYSEAINVIGEALKNVITRIVDFMPRDGVLGTAKNSAVAALIQDGNPFPDNYFWQCETELLEFNRNKVTNVTKQRAILLLTGIFIFRALVTTLLVKPIKYRLMLGELKPNQTASLKVLASVMLYVGRLAAKSTPQILALPHEWHSSLYRDTDIEPIIQHAEIKSIITKCELSLRLWCEEYIRRIDASYGKELRT